MQASAARIDQTVLPARLASRGDLTAFLMQTAGSVGADNYLLLAIQHDQDKIGARIVAANWIYDAIELAGSKLIASLAQSQLTASPGVRPGRLSTVEAPALPSVLNGEQARLLAILGHTDIYSLALNVGRLRYFLMFSSATADAIDIGALMRAHIECCYALSLNPALLASTTLLDPLSDRERECLFWVAEGKTTDEVSTILGVSPNTVNSYLTHAIQKLSASNRAEAMATAIRSGII